MEQQFNERGFRFFSTVRPEWIEIDEELAKTVNLKETAFEIEVSLPSRKSEHEFSMAICFFGQNKALSAIRVNFETHRILEDDRGGYHFQTAYSLFAFPFWFDDRMESPFLDEIDSLAFLLSEHKSRIRNEIHRAAREIERFLWAEAEEPDFDPKSFSISLPEDDESDSESGFLEFDEKAFACFNEL